MELEPTQPAPPPQQQGWLTALQTLRASIRDYGDVCGLEFEAPLALALEQLRAPEVGSAPVDATAFQVGMQDLEGVVRRYETAFQLHNMDRRVAGFVSLLRVVHRALGIAEKSGNNIRERLGDLLEHLDAAALEYEVVKDGFESMEDAQAIAKHAAAARRFVQWASTHFPGAGDDALSEKLVFIDRFVSFLEHEAMSRQRTAEKQAAKPKKRGMPKGPGRTLRCGICGQPVAHLERAVMFATNQGDPTTAVACCDGCKPRARAAFRMF
jgi:hypothetical protein